MIGSFLDSISVNLLNIARCELNSGWNYQNIISPFTRIFFITKGEAFIFIHQEKISLREGNLYLIPAYTNCSYWCDDSFEMYYLHFTNEISRGMKIFDIYKYTPSVPASNLDKALFERLLEINPNKHLFNSNPYVYQKDLWTNQNKDLFIKNNSLESNGIIMQLLSRHIPVLEPKKEALIEFSRLKKIFSYIDCHLNKELSVAKLAHLACYSEDHFSRLFKKITGLNPIEYITKKRIEHAQMMIITSDKSLPEIQQNCGFNSLSYFYRTFKKTTGTSPSLYRKLHMEI